MYRNILLFCLFLIGCPEPIKSGELKNEPSNLKVLDRVYTGDFAAATPGAIVSSVHDYKHNVTCWTLFRADAVAIQCMRDKDLENK